MGILWIILIGFVAGFVARLIMPGPNKPMGFVVTTVLGIAGAFLSTFIGQAVGWYRPDQGAGFIAAATAQSSFYSSGTVSLPPAVSQITAPDLNG